MAGPFDTERELKRLFAIGVLKRPLRKPSDSYDIATSIFGGDTIGAMRAGASWPTDPEVMAFKDALLTEFGAEYFLPTKEELARQLLDIAEEKYETGQLKHSADERRALLKLYAEVMGYIEKQRIPGSRTDGNAPPDIVFAPYPK